MTLWGEPERVYVQKSTHREAGLAISMLHTGLSSARRKEADESTLAALFDVR